MASRRRLTPEERQEIVRERLKGLTHAALAAKFGVSERTVYYTLRTEKDRRRDTRVRTKQVSVTLTPEELQGFDEVLTRHGVSSRSAGVRLLIQSANGVFQPDQHLAEELKSFRAALNRVGNNVTQIAKRLNEARAKGIAPVFGDPSLTQLRLLSGFVLDFADQVDALARRRVSQVTLEAHRALKDFSDVPE
ncbi:helix-turn-helix domain-containing protein [Shimia ponticola]|uniref:helix-turn-helix domain-containing protein n=1 Tax=Shimia ponticola TaxID=2582893 RepID=UPI00164AB04A|nr:helix-turn-helix domain-containing protein [Shimia ponticola]